MDNNLKQLIELQKIDSRLLNIEKLRGDLPNTEWIEGRLINIPSSVV